MTIYGGPFAASTMDNGPLTLNVTEITDNYSSGSYFHFNRGLRPARGPEVTTRICPKTSCVDLPDHTRNLQYRNHRYRTSYHLYAPRLGGCSQGTLTLE